MKEEINEKANYCLNCKVKPCSTKGCPLGNDIPHFIEKLREEEYEEAYKILCKTTVLPGICGRICPHEKQCQGSCIRGIKGEPVSIGELETYIFEKARKEGNSLLKVWQDEIKSKKKINGNKKVAIIGGGPAGLTCSAFLAKNGVDVTIYEKYNYLGGLLVHGIPEFRLSKEIVKETVNNILELGIKVEYNRELGKDITLNELRKKYNAIFLSIGANVSSKMGVEGEELDGVFGGNELLEYNLHPNYKGKKVAIIGGGNVAMDCARTIKRLGAKEVKVIYRRAREQMPAEDKEVNDAIQEGVEFLFQNNLVKIIGKDKVEKVELIKTELVKKDEDTRLVPVNIRNSNYVLDVDYVVMALGSKAEKFVSELGLDLNKWENIIVDDNYETSVPKVFAGGDVAGIKSTVAWSAFSGRETARQILKVI